MTTPSSEALADPELGSECLDRQTRGWGRQHHCDPRPIRPQARPPGSFSRVCLSSQRAPWTRLPSCCGRLCSPPLPPAPPGPADTAQTRGSWWSLSGQQSHSGASPLFLHAAGKVAFCFENAQRCPCFSLCSPQTEPGGVAPSSRFPLQPHFQRPGFRRCFASLCLVPCPAIDFSLFKVLSTVYLFIQDYFIIMSY